MKTKLTLALSVIGVLAAGSAAAMVNTELLDAATPVTTATEAVTEAGDGGADDTGGTSTAGTAVTVVPVQPPGSAATAGSTATYRVGDAGTVAVRTEGDVLRIAGAEAAAGWQLVETEQEARGLITATFRSASTEIEFRASLVHGVVDTSVRVTDRTTSAGSSVDDVRLADVRVDDRDHEDDDDERGTREADDERESDDDD